MKSIRRNATTLLIAGALALPILASAVPTLACDGEKAEGKQPTAQRAKPKSDKADQKADEKSETKTDAKADSAQAGKS